MTVFSAADLDRAAAQAVADLRALAAVWDGQGAAALDAAVRNDPAFSFAVLDTRRGGQGFVRLLAARPPAAAGPELVLSFAVSAAGARRIVVRSSDGCVLEADPALAQVRVGPQDHDLALELAWRFEIGVDEMVAPPAGFDDPPSGFIQPLACWSETALLHALAVAAAMLDGSGPFVAGAVEIHHALRQCGLEPTPHVLYAVQDSFYDIRFDAAAPPDDPRHLADKDTALAELEAWARIEGRADCAALLERFHGPAFAMTDA